MSAYDYYKANSRVRAMSCLQFILRKVVYERNVDLFRQELSTDYNRIRILPFIRVLCRFVK